MRASSRPFQKTGPEISYIFCGFIDEGILDIAVNHHAERNLSTEAQKGHRVTVGQVFLDDHVPVQLQSGGKSVLLKKALILFQGEFMGQFGPVKVTDELLSAITERFNRQFKSPKNEFDYPPLLVDHNRSADLIKGRLTGPLEVHDWNDPRDGLTKKAIFSDVRVDLEDAQEKVNAGQYSQLSLSFSDEMEDLGEIFELSFVAVEAARGAQVLKQGVIDMSVELQAKLDKANSRIAVLQSSAKTKKLVIGTSATSLASNIEAMLKDNESASKQLSVMAGKLRTTVVSGRLDLCVKQGKLTPDERKKIDVDKITLMTSDSRSCILSSYDSRPVSTDLAQHGMYGAKPLSSDNVELTASQMREAMKCQRAGKEYNPPAGANLAAALNAVNLAGHDNGEDKKKKEDDDNPELTGKAMDEALESLAGITALQDKITETGTRLKDLVSQLEGENKKEDDDAA